VVKNFTLESVSLARRQALALGLVPQVQFETSDRVASNHVIRQMPAPKTKIERNQTIVLFVSSGAPATAMPKVSHAVQPAKLAIAVATLNTPKPPTPTPTTRPTVAEATSPSTEPSETTAVSSDSPENVAHEDLPSYATSAGVAIAAPTTMASTDGYPLGSLGHFEGKLVSLDGIHLAVGRQSFIMLQPFADGVARQILGRTVRVYYQVREHNSQDDDHGRTASEIDAYDTYMKYWQTIYRDPRVPTGA